MATFLSNGLLFAVLLQGSPPASTPSPAHASSVHSTQARSEEGARARVLHDSSDGRAWRDFGRELVELASGYHEHGDTAIDTAWVRAALDSADEAFSNAVRLLSDTRAGDSAEVWRVAARAERSLLEWEVQGEAGVPAAWRGVDEADLSPVLEELGENLLRGCPRNGIVLTAGELDGAVVGYMRFVRGLRPDLAVIPHDAWRSDAVLRRRMAGDLKLERLADRRPVCATMAFERPPDLRRPVRWHKRPFLWVAGPRATADQVAPRDFGFAALGLASYEQDTWLDPVLLVYRRAARQSPALCEPLRVYGLAVKVGCR